MKMAFLILIVIIPFVLASPPVSALGEVCERIFERQEKLRQVGVETIFKGMGKSVVIAVAMPGPRGHLLNLNALGHGDRLPISFIYSDGAFDTPFIEVDSHPGTPLDIQIKLFAADVERNASIDQEAKLDYLRTFIAQRIGEVHGTGDQQALPVPEVEEVINEPVGHFPLSTQLSKKVVKLESFLSSRQGNCVPKTILTSLILRRLGIKHAIRAGATELSGHLWIELDDGRILDPTWQVIERPHFNGSWPGWFGFSRSYLRLDPVYPITVDDK
jgi:hypothetical protein